jgi:hypothetical protein
MKTMMIKSLVSKLSAWGNIASFMGNIASFMGNIASFMGNIASFIFFLS